MLGVARGASESEIKKKYYQLAKKYHPDTNSVRRVSQPAGWQGPAAAAVELTARLVLRSVPTQVLTCAFPRVSPLLQPQGDPGAAKKFQEVQRAYDTLRDPQKRQVRRCGGLQRRAARLLVCWPAG